MVASVQKLVDDKPDPIDYSNKPSQLPMPSPPPKTPHSQNVDSWVARCRERKIGIVVAHFHSKGVISKGLIAFLNAFPSDPSASVFVSTNLTIESSNSLPQKMKVLRRDNIGYDFESYRNGIGEIGDIESLDHLIILNSSFIILDHARLCSAVISKLDSEDADIVALTASNERARHAQSYFISFSRKVVTSKAFADWWADLTPTSERQEVIDRYEIGMSRYFMEKGFTISAVYEPTDRQRLCAVRRAIKCGYLHTNPDAQANAMGSGATVDINAGDALNPTHFMWDFLLDHCGIVKTELIERNPLKIDLTELEEFLNYSTYSRELIAEISEKRTSNEPRLAIYCVAYKRYDTILVLVYSLMCQTYRDFRLVVIHDGEDVEMQALLTRLKATYPERFDFLFTEKRFNDYGHSLRQMAIEQCQSEFILLTNDDNYYAPPFLEHMFNKIDSDGLDVVLCDMIHNYDIHGKPSYNALITQPKRLFVDIGCFIARTKLAKQVGFRDKTHNGDATYFEDLVAANRNIKIGKVDKVLFVHN